jgi:AraC-like DNA-binding protein
MDAHSDEDWPVERLAQVSCMSSAHFARAFKKAFGVPPHRYLLSRRIERAHALLRETDRPIADIAFETGWGSLGTFGRTFRDVTGDSPGGKRAQPKRSPESVRPVPSCILSAADRPDLRSAVLEKRRKSALASLSAHQGGREDE